MPSNSANDRIEAKIDYWKKKLLDLSRRNPQLNFNPTAKNRIEFIYPDATTLFDTLVVKGKEITLPPIFSLKFDMGIVPKKKKSSKISKEPINQTLNSNQSLPIVPINSADGAIQSPPSPSTDQTTTPITQISDIEIEENEEKKYDPNLHQNYIAKKQKSLKKFEVITNQYDELLHRNMNNLQIKAKSDIEEQGINSAYITFGLVKWYESMKERQFLYSPLIFIPIQIVRENVLSDFKISIADDDIIINPSLSKKFSDDYKISIPDFPEEFESEDFIAYLTKFKEIIKKNPDFDLENRVFLGIFKFNKFNLYNDLLNFSNAVKRHPIISAIASGAGSYRNKVDIPNDEELESIPATQVFTIMDADSSQLKAIQAARRGVSMIIQGPPGTGKSQCIANIIAECMAAGKKVLFVSQKKAALDVVKKRLDDNSIGFFCLELHSQKAKKAEILDQIRRSRDICLVESNHHGHLYEEFDQAKNRLNDYLNAVHDDSLSKRKKSFYDFITIIGSQKKEISRLWRLKNPLDLNNQDFAQIEQNLRALQGDLKEIPIFRNSLWNKLTPPQNQLPSEFEISDLLHEYNDHLKAGLDFISLRQIKYPNQKETQANWSYSIEILRYWIEIFELFEHWNNIYQIEQKIKPVIPIALNDPLINQFYTIQQMTQNFSVESIQQMIGAIESIIQEIQIFTGSFLKITLQSDSELSSIFNIIQKIHLNLLNEDLEAYIILFREKFIGIKRFFLPQFYKMKKHIAGFFKSLNLPILETLEKIQNVKSMLSVQTLQIIPNFESALQTLYLSWDQYQTQLDAFKPLINQISLDLSIKKNEWQNKQSNLQLWIKNLDFYPMWRNISSIRNELKKWQLHTIIDEYSPNEIGTKDLWTEFQHQYLLQVLQAILQKYSYLKSFTAVEHEKLIRKFIDLDTKRLHLNKIRIFAQILDLRPKLAEFMHDQQSTDIGFLEHELSKTRNIKPLRKIFALSKNYITKIMPCFMMSPLSVASYLPITDFEQYFDVVIFDEASQVCPEDAIGAILRGRQLIVAGDEQQLPPTSFFNSTSFLEEDTEDIEDLESILKECSGIGFNNVPLNWHYRSRKEGLIAYSNRHFYQDKLQTFPDPRNNKFKSNTNPAKDIGNLPAIEYVYVTHGLYENQMNKIEAARVANAIIHHFKENPALSLGVIAFSLKQEGAIRSALDALIREDSSLEELLKSNKQEEFFIKNLESVQGDERDFIFFSIGYGPNSAGQISANFGPLNREGGYRRLNVAITRAKIHIKIFCSFLPGSIGYDRSAASGFQKLLKYLEFSHSGVLDAPTSTQPKPLVFESEFEEQVAQQLRNMGYEIDTQVGCSNYRIDIAVIDPDQPNRYLLGIECDGASYHSTRSARDRDRIRHEVLTRLGWNLFHIWSPEWFKSPQNVLSQIRKTIEQLRKTPSPTKNYSPSPGVTEIKIATKEPNGKTTASQQKTPEFREKFFQIQGICEYNPYPSVQQYQKETFYNSNHTRMSVIQKIIENEGPIHQNLLEKHIKTVFGINSIGNRIRTILNSDYYSLKRVGDFFLPSTQKGSQIRICKDYRKDPRKFDEIYDQEIGRCMKIVTDLANTKDQDVIFNKTASMFGFVCKTEYYPRLQKIYKDFVR
jgi:superfamily I DNA and/or RNA helicase/very-short-patch-repair endonuclease